MKKFETLIGSSSVLNALSSFKRKLYKLYVTDSVIKCHKINRALDLAKDRGIAIECKSMRFLTKYCDDQPHGGLILDASHMSLDILRGLSSFNQFGYQGLISATEKTSFNSKGKVPVWIALEEIVDPRNVGAILRSCYFFGVDGVIMSCRNSSPVNSTVSRTSAGALEIMDNLYLCYNLSSFLKTSKDNGWNIYGTDLAKTSRSLKDLKKSNPSIIVFGNEGEGLSDNISKICTEHLIIPGENSITADSLNVAVSAGILIHEFKK